MAIFRPKPWVNAFRKSSIFRHFELLVFIAQKGIFSFYNIVKIIFLTNIAEKQMLEKRPYKDQNHGLTTLKKCQFFDFGTSCFYCLKRRFLNLKYRKSHFPNLQYQKKNVGKMAIFGATPWVNPFGKMSIFRILELLVFIAYKGAFSFQIIVKVIFLTYSAEKKNVGKMAIFGPTPWLNPFGKSSIFRHSELPVFIAKKGVFLTF